MGKKILTVLALAFVCAALVSSCGDGDNVTEETSPISDVPEIVTECESHRFGVWEIITAATCNEEGKVRRTCEKCGYTERESTMKPDHLYVDNVCDACGYVSGASSLCQHTFSEWKTVKEPTCIADGQRQRICGLCGQIERQIAPKTGAHSKITLPERAPTCYMEGYTEHIYCVYCELVFKERQYLKMRPHNYQNRVCTVCGMEEG